MDYPDYFSKVVSSNQVVIVMQQGADSVLAIPSAFILQWVADAIYIFVALVWIIPDRRVESKLSE
ncbi:MAG: hypothetical protein WBV94_02295 [Blastocatellia bacterium]